MSLANLLLHWTGGDNGSGPIYLELSGFIGALSIFAGIIVFYYKHNCHAKGCPWIGIHQVAGTPFITCRRHHPVINKKHTWQEIHILHRKANKK